jgi:hypothetical protein
LLGRGSGQITRRKWSTLRFISVEASECACLQYTTITPWVEDPSLTWRPQRRLVTASHASVCGGLRISRQDPLPHTYWIIFSPQTPHRTRNGCFKTKLSETAISRDFMTINNQYSKSQGTPYLQPCGPQGNLVTGFHHSGRTLPLVKQRHQAASCSRYKWVDQVQVTGISR